MVSDDSTPFRPDEIPLLRALSAQYPTIDAAAAEIAHLSGILTLPKGTVHVVSDVHGEHKKLQHIVNNASGFLRPLLETVFGARLSADDKQRLLNTIYYPSQLFSHLGLAGAPAAERARFVETLLRQQFAVLGELRRRYPLDHVEALFPDDFGKLFRELLWEAPRSGQTERRSEMVSAQLHALVARGRGLTAVRWASRVIRNLSVYELIVAGDLGDRGPRLDKVSDILTRQPRVTLTWGNHDVAWIGACLGHDALIATILRICLRYHTLAQLEDGYGVAIASLEKLAREVYRDDPAERFKSKAEGFREPVDMARMQKAIAIMQFKLEAQVIARNPGWDMDHRALMRTVDPERGVVVIDGVEHSLTDRHLPTVDPADPAALSAEESVCMERLRGSFFDSPRLWQHIQFWARVGATYVVRDGNLIFHGAVPVDDSGDMQALTIDGAPRGGRALFDAFSTVVQRAVRHHRQADLDWLWYLWTGPRSPMFGKDKMTTFERYFVADKTTHKEKKNHYFQLLHDPDFCRRLLVDFGGDPESGMIVNGHVPVKPDRGEEPLKDSRKAITIDGAFSEAYGDRGYTLIFDCDGTRLAEHHHFESIAEALHSGADIVPEVRDIQRFDRARRIGDTERGDDIRGQIAALERLIAAYHENVIVEGRS